MSEENEPHSNPETEPEDQPHESPSEESSSQNEPRQESQHDTEPVQPEPVQEATPEATTDEGDLSATVTPTEQLEETVAEQPSLTEGEPSVPSKKPLRKKFKEALKESLLAFKDIKLKSMSPLTYVVALVLFVAFAALQFIDIKLTFPILSFVLPSTPLLIPISIVTAFVFIIVWIALGITFAGPFARFLIENKLARTLFTRGDVYYIEHVPETEEIIGFGMLIAKTIALIIAWAAMAATIFSAIASILSLILGGFDPAGLIVLDPDQRNQLGLPPLSGITGPLVFIFQIVVIYILSPLLVTVIIPIPWMLIDVRLKAFDSKNSKLNWFIGRKVQQRTRNFVSIAAIVGLGATYTIINRVEIILQMVALILVYMALPSVIMAFLYLLMFQSRLKQDIIMASGAPFGRTIVELLHENQETSQASTSSLDDGSATTTTD